MNYTTLKEGIGKEALPNIAARFSDLGQSRSEVVHWSAPNRYRAIFDLLTLPTIRLSNELLLVRQLLLRGKVLTIRDCAAGSGQAIVALAQTLRSKGLACQVTAADLVDPRAIVLPSFAEEFDRATQQSVQFDVRAEADPNLHFTLSILGYLHPYLSADELAAAITNRLAESDVVAIIPAGDKPHSPLSCLFIGRSEENNLTIVEFDPSAARR